MPVLPNDDNAAACTRTGGDDETRDGSALTFLPPRDGEGLPCVEDVAAAVFFKGVAHAEPASDFGLALAGTGPGTFDGGEFFQAEGRGGVVASTVVFVFVEALSIAEAVGLDPALIDGK